MTFLEDRQAGLHSGEWRLKAVPSARYFHVFHRRPLCAPDNDPYCAQFGRGSIITAAMKKFHRAGCKVGLFAVRRLSLPRCHRVLTALTVASSSLIMPLAVFKPAWPEEIQQVRREPQPSKCDRSQFRVILDVGHTAEAFGAISARNVPEYYFNYRLAAQIERSLIEDGFNKTVLLVTGDPARPSLFDRVARANGLSPNLLVSIHHDSVPDSLLE